MTALLWMGGQLTGCGQDTAEYPSSKVEFEVEYISEDFENPWSFTFLPDQSMLVTEKKGKLYHLKNGVKTEVTELPQIYVRGQGGLMDIQLHPNYEDNQWIYIAYGHQAEGENGGNTAVARGRIIDHQWVDHQVLFKASPGSRRGQHWGGRLAFDDSGFLYVTVGDRGARDENPQSLSNHSGKVHRLLDDGGIPSDNPFLDIAGAQPSIYSYGHRNPQGIAIHPVTGRTWIHEHGPRGGDELNVLYPGKNYGWPVISYGINYSGTKFTDLTEKEGMEQPVKYWVPSIAPCGMTFVVSDLYPEWKNSVLIGSLKFNYIHRIELNGESMSFEEKVLEDIGRVRTIREGPDGYIYVSIEGKGIVKIKPKKT